MPATRMLEDSTMQIAMDEGWFDMASFVALALCNKQLNAPVARDHLRKPFLDEIEFLHTGLIDDSDWKSRDIPPSLGYHTRALLILKLRINNATDVQTDVEALTDVGRKTTKARGTKG